MSVGYPEELRRAERETEPDWSRLQPWKPVRGVSVPTARPYVTMKTPGGRPGVEVGVKGKF